MFSIMLSVNGQVQYDVTAQRIGPAIEGEPAQYEVECHRMRRDSHGLRRRHLLSHTFVTWPAWKGGALPELAAHVLMALSPACLPGDATGVR